MDLYRKISAFKADFNKVCRKDQKDPASVQILFATKYLNGDQLISFTDIMKQIDSSMLLIGENRVQDWEKKNLFIKEMRPDLLDNIYPVMIGNLQKNKINKAIELFKEIHSVDSLKLASVLNNRLASLNRTVPIYLEVNISGEETKHGFAVKEIEDAIKAIELSSYLELKGLMTMSLYSDDLEEIRGIYRMLRELANRYNLKTSMGMSHDWKIAVEQGSDMIRIGSAIFN